MHVYMYVYVKLAAQSQAQGLRGCGPCPLRTVGRAASPGAASPTAQLALGPGGASLQRCRAAAIAAAIGCAASEPRWQPAAQPPLPCLATIPEKMLVPLISCCRHSTGGLAAALVHAGREHDRPRDGGEFPPPPKRTNTQAASFPCASAHAPPLRFQIVCSVAGAEYNLALIWTLVVACLVAFIQQEESVRPPSARARTRVCERESWQTELSIAMRCLGKSEPQISASQARLTLVSGDSFGCSLRRVFGVMLPTNPPLATMISTCRRINAAFMVCSWVVRGRWRIARSLSSAT